MPSTKEDALRQRILTAADNLFRANGLNKTTMDEIARLAGKSKSNLYYYFASKEEIFDEIISTERERFFQALQQAVSKAASAKEKLEAFSRARLTLFTTWVNLYSVVIAEQREALASNDEAPANKYRQAYDEKLVSILENIVQYGIVTGEFRIMSDKELEMLVFVVISASQGIERNLIIHGKLNDMVKQIDFFQDLLYHGLKKTDI
ncbi:TetR/AcrR family transcriptional regulator [Dyadobacter crusticola]|uniref:TetR/AcrR family transcriptional regulator n=1 Tax=Dyadobacter crusticola TaxID=292407 RepID=UPI00069200E5|nr:TetR/AcrR family transcriptional regulator [Dyadobacter crusticola]